MKQLVERLEASVGSAAAKAAATETAETASGATTPRAAAP